MDHQQSSQKIKSHTKAIGAIGAVFVDRRCWRAAIRGLRIRPQAVLTTAGNLAEWTAHRLRPHFYRRQESDDGFDVERRTHYLPPCKEYGNGEDRKSLRKD